MNGLIQSINNYSKNVINWLSGYSKPMWSCEVVENQRDQLPENENLQVFIKVTQALKTNFSWRVKLFETT
jgi:hypothetical protein